MRVACVLSVALAAAASFGSSASAQTTSGPAAAPAAVAETGRAAADFPPLAEPEVISRDQQGRTTVRAVRLTQNVEFDGRLDDQVYDVVRPITGFFQTLPDAGEPATEETEVWVFFDDEHVYFSARCWQRDIVHTLVANEMRRDLARENDNFGVAVDTFYDRQNGFLFYTTPLGALGDGYVGEGPGATSTDFNPVWDVRTGRFDGGWTVEMKVPFKTLRYRPGRSQTWGIQFRRVIRHRGETAFLTKLPITAGSRGIGRMSYAATLVGIEVAGDSKNLEVKPYGVSRLTSDRAAVPPTSREPGGDVGIDLKYGVTQNLTADFTVNTDFAQVEVDDQQVNLTRFNLLFPEKRQFFLEGMGNFRFGGEGAGAPQLFFSRQIGLSRGRVVPIVAGGRMTGKIGRFSLGALNIQAGEEAVSGTPKANFTVLRVKRDVLKKSQVGVIFTGRSASVVSPGHGNQAYGVDGAFAFYDNLDMGGYYARTETPGLRGKSDSYRASLEFAPDLYGVTLDHLFIGDAFNPEVGFVRRADMRRSYASARFSPRPNDRTVRRYVFSGSVEYILDTAGILESRDQEARFETEFQNSDQAMFGATRSFDRLLQPFQIASGVTIPVGGYAFDTFRAAYELGAQKRWTGSASIEHGSFYGGDQTAVGLGSGRVAITPQFSVEPSFSLNWIDLPNGAFTTQLYRSRLNFTFSPRMFVAGLVQYNSSNDTFSTNVRLRWEYSPGSELFVVYTDERLTDPLRGPFADPLNRAFVVKLNRLFRF